MAICCKHQQSSNFFFSFSLYLLAVLHFLCSRNFFSMASNITYSHRALIIDGKPRLLISGSIHYPRSTPEMWPDLIKKSKDGGLDVVETYVFWDLHEPVRNQYDFQGRKDLVRFIKTIAEAGLYVHLRIGPYVCAEWNYGGFPVWLHFIPGIKLRTDNGPFKAEMKRFTAKIVNMMKQENLYASQGKGGPIILSQIENEYGNIDKPYGPAAISYINWAASMAVSLETGVPWVMCQQADAPDPIINTCNGFYCDQFTPNSANKPKLWTENWTGWFLLFGGPVPYRPVEDIAFAVARFFQRGGTFQNYYMYHGGTNFGHSSGGPFIATSYDYDAPIDEYGMLRQPKWNHLKDLHKAIKLCEEALLATDPTYTSLGSNLEAHVYKTATGSCAAFIANIGDQSDATVTFNGKTYRLPAWSVSILPDCKNVVFNTAQINSQSTTMESLYLTSETQTDESTAPSATSLTDWSFVNEPVGISRGNSFQKKGLLEQINTTADSSDYLWYSVSVDVNGNESFLNGKMQSNLYIQSLGHVLHVFVNGNLSGSRKGTKIIFENIVNFTSGKNKIDLLSATVGLQNYGSFFDLVGAGITGPVQLRGQNGTLDLSFEVWTYQIGLKGEESGLSSGSVDSSEWSSLPSIPKYQPLTWYKASFSALDGDDPVAIDFTGMGKGEAWINGQSIGRYWPINAAPENGCSSCSYKGTFNSDKCQKNCGKPSQTLYHLPRSMVQPGANTMVLFEEMGGDPERISFAIRQVKSICGHVSEAHPAPMAEFNLPNEKPDMNSSAASLKLECLIPNQVISSISFASFGTPSGTCGAFSHGRCSSTEALAIVKQACVGLKSCSISVSTSVFGNPCSEQVIKSLAVEAACT